MVEYFRKVKSMSKPDNLPANESSSDEDFDSLTAGFAGFGIDPYRLEAL